MKNKNQSSVFTVLMMVILLLGITLGCKQISRIANDIETKDIPDFKTESNSENPLVKKNKPIHN